MDSEYVVLGECNSDGTVEIINEAVLENIQATNTTDIPALSNVMVVEVLCGTLNEDDRKRKRKKNEANWKVHQLQTKRQMGEEYINSRGKVIAQKMIKNKKNCENCKFKCATAISESERQLIFKHYYSLDRFRKYDFLLKFTSESEIVAKKTGVQSNRRKKSFGYYLEIKGEIIRVCKPYFLGTLDISQKIVYDVHNKKTITGLIEVKPKTGNRQTKQEVTDRIKRHINSFPVIESHYCRAKTSKKYLEAGLNIQKMYDLYASQCSQNEENPAKSSYYRKVFCTEFNLEFHKPKSDRCGKCEEYRIAENAKLCTPQLTKDFEEHQRLKVNMRIDRNEDRDNKNIPVLCFDLENVINCPKTNIGPLFYSSKLTVYNLTAHFSTTKKIYCCLWTEYTAGRTGNDIASALIKILEKVYDDSGFTKLITWSDSCVPQNKNSYMATAILRFMRDHPDVEEVTMKYSIAGHSAIQEVDNAHSQIEKVLTKNEFLSPLGLIRILKNINIKKPFCILQMTPTDFKDYEEYSKLMYTFKEVPFSKLKVLQFNQENHLIKFKLDHAEESFQICNLRKQKNRYSLGKQPNIMDVNTIKKKPKIDKKKISDLQAAFCYMTPQDIAYYKVILNLNDTEPLCKTPKGRVNRSHLLKRLENTR